MTAGIYLIKNKITNSIYIGQSVNIKKRWRQHVNQLKNNKHGNPYLQNAWNKYGEKQFNFSIIEEFPDNTPFLKDVLNDVEEYYIRWLNAFQDDNNYNMTPGGMGRKNITKDNNPNYKNYARISKAGFKNNNQIYRIRYKAKNIVRSQYLGILQKVFKLYFNEDGTPKYDINDHILNQKIQSFVKQQSNIKMAHSKSQQTLWDSMIIHCDKRKITNSKYANKIFTLKFHSYRLPIGLFHDFISCEIINKIIQEEIVYE